MGEFRASIRAASSRGICSPTVAFRTMGASCPVPRAPALRHRRHLKRWSPAPGSVWTIMAPVCRRYGSGIQY